MRSFDVHSEVNTVPIRYVQTLGAVAGIPQVVNIVEITMEKPTGAALTMQHPSGALITMDRPTGAVITLTPPLTPDYGGD